MIHFLFFFSFRSKEINVSLFLQAVMFLDVTSGLLSASAAFTAHYVCNYLATPVEGIVPDYIQKRT